MEDYNLYLQNDREVKNVLTQLVTVCQQYHRSMPDLEQALKGIAEPVATDTSLLDKLIRFLRAKMNHPSTAKDHPVVRHALQRLYGLLLSEQKRGAAVSSEPGDMKSAGWLDLVSNYNKALINMRLQQRLVGC